MTQEHPIVPPPELVEQWWEESNRRQYTVSEAEDYVVSMAAQWGADQQLAEDAKWLDHNALNEPYLRITPVGESLKEAMRPNLPSLKEQALEALKHAPGPDYPNPITLLTADEHALIRRALEQLDD
jgi:hypothetical protein